MKPPRFLRVRGVRAAEVYTFQDLLKYILFTAENQKIQPGKIAINTRLTDDVRNIAVRRTLQLCAIYQ